MLCSQWLANAARRDRSVSSWSNQRLTALSQGFMSLRARLMLKPCVLTICTTCSLKLVSSTLLNSGLLTSHTILALTSCLAVFFYWTSTLVLGCFDNSLPCIRDNGSEVESGRFESAYLDFTRFNRHLSRSKLNWRASYKESQIPG